MKKHKYTHLYFSVGAAVALTGLIYAARGTVQSIHLSKIDDTFAAQETLAAQTTTVHTIADAFVNAGSVNKNFGTDTQLKVAAESPIRFSYLKFDTAEVTGKSILNATLRLKVQNNPASVRQIVYPVATDSWEEGTLTYANRPTPGVDIVDEKTGGTKEQWIDFNVTSALAADTDGVLSLAIQTDTSDVVNYYSRETTQIPQLIIEYEGEPGTPTPTPEGTQNPSPTPTPVPTPTNTPTPSQTPAPTTAGVIQASVETDPVTHDRDAADDPAIWIHPTDTSLSLIIGTDKKGALEVYDLTGAKRQIINDATSNVDLRYNFPFNGTTIDIVVSHSMVSGRDLFYKVNPNTRMLEAVGTATNNGRPAQVGLCMYHSATTGKYYYFTNFKGILRQFELFDAGNGTVGSNLVRSWTFAATDSEGCVADDITGALYASEETNGIWKLNAEPTAGNSGVLIDKVIGKGGHISPDIEGLAIYYKTDGTGYLFASGQDANEYNIYQREGNNSYIGKFIVEAGIIDGTDHTDGIDITNFPLNGTFGAGLFVAQDGPNDDGKVKKFQNFKLVSFQSIADKFGLALDTAWDPRLVGRN